MKKGVAITGMGIISSIGNTVEENLYSLLNYNKRIAPLSSIESKHKGYIRVGEVSLSNKLLAEHLKLTSGKIYSRTALLGCVAAKQAVVQSNIDPMSSKYDTGLISATSVGGMDITETYFNITQNDDESIKWIGRHHAGDSTEKIAKLLGVSDYVSTISTACSSGANAIMLGARLINSGKLDRVIVGGTDSLTKFTINGFNTLMILSDKDCAPFDYNRKGLNLGEAAAFLVLESDKLIRLENKDALAYITGYGNSNDAFHQTASSADGEGAFLAMQKALTDSNLQSDNIDYINLHGTATPNNDLSEGKAIKRTFGDNIPDFSSTKAYTGHTLAAAGAIEAVYSVLALQNNVMFPNLNFKTPIPELQMIPITKVIKKQLKNVLSNSFGFGGNCSSIIFSKS